MSDETGISVSLLYSGHKARLFAGSLDDASKKILMDDLLQLKLPHPKRENIRRIAGKKGLHGCYFFWPRVNSVLYKNIKNRVVPPPNFAVAHQELLSELSIVSLTYKQLSLSGEKEQTTSSHGAQHPRFPHKQWVRNDVPSPRLDAAQQLLDDVALSFRPHKVPKIEHVDPPLLFDFPNQSTSFHRNESIASSRAPSHYSRGSTPMVISPPNEPTTSSALTFAPVDFTEEFLPPGLIKTQPMTPVIPQKRLRTPDPDPGPLPDQPGHGIPQPKPSDLPKIQTLTRELWDLRRQVTAGMAREATIIKELKALNSAFIPKPSEYITSQEYTAMKAELQRVEAEVQTERKQRKDVEAILADIKRECREPFVVPGLFEAFVSISKITSQALNDI